MMKDYVETLKHPVIGRLSIIQLVSYFGTWFSQVAIFSMLVSYGASEVTIALVDAMSMFPAVILAPLIGVMIDRIDFKKLIHFQLQTFSKSIVNFQQFFHSRYIS